MNINLVSIHIKKGSPLSMPLAAGILMSELLTIPEIKDKANAMLSDYYISDNVERITGDIISADPDLIGFSAYLWNTGLIKLICRKLKELKPLLTIMAGGAEPSSNPEIFSDCPEIDYIVTGEGEEAVKEIVLSLLNKKKLSGRIIQSEIIDDIDGISSPFLEKAIDPADYDGVVWELSRGCPFKCDYCFESRGTGAVRKHSMERIRKELEYFEEKKVVQVFVLDPAFNADKERAKNILKLIKETAPGIHFTFEVRAEFVDAELASLFSRVHCSLQIGLQSSDAAVCSNVGRNFSIEKFTEKIKMLDKKGVVYGLDLIYGLPGETIKGFEKSLNYALELRPNNIDIFPLSVIAGTGLYEKAGSLGIKYDKNSPYEIISSPGFDVHDIEYASGLKYACDIFYNKGGAVGWFHIASRELEISGAEILGKFFSFLKIRRHDCMSRSGITDIQIVFLQNLFNESDKGFLFPPLRNLIRYHGASDISLYKGSIEDEYEGDMIIGLPPSTILLDLDYEPDELRHADALSLRAFMKKYKMRKNNTVVYNNNGNINAVTVDARWNCVLNYINKSARNKDEIIRKFPEIKRNELNGFVNFIIEEKIAVHSVKRH